MAALNVGAEYCTKNFGTLVIVEDLGFNKVKVKFNNTGALRGGLKRNNILRGSVRDLSVVDSPTPLAVGSTYKTKNYGDIKVLSDEGFEDVCVLFLDTKVIKANLRRYDVKQGNVKDDSVLLPKHKNLIGKYVNGFYFIKRREGYKWEVRYKCGCIKVKTLSEIRSSKSGNCTSCLDREGLNVKHGASARGSSIPLKKTYKSWDSMKQRCHNKNNDNFKHYGGKGITVCPEWRFNFDNFLRDMGLRPNNHTLDRIDADKEYCKDNCRWADSITQGNNKRHLIRISKGGKIMSMTYWCRELDLNYRSCLRRYHAGESVPTILGVEYSEVVK